MTALYPIVSAPVGHVFAILALLLFFGLAFGTVARLLRLPSLTGNIFAGILLGPVFGLVNTSSAPHAAQLELITEVALSIIAVSIGSHLKFRALRNAFKRIGVIVMIQSLTVPFVVAGGLYGLLTVVGATYVPPFETAVFMGILALATAPATAIHIVKESQAKGLFVKTLITVIVLNNAAAITLFEVAKDYLYSPDHQIMRVVQIIGSSVLLGAGMAAVSLLSYRLILCNQRRATLSAVALLICYGAAIELGLSPMIATMVLGIVITNVSDRNELLDSFENFEELIYGLFFTLTGTHAHLEHASTVGAFAVGYMLLRTMGNLLAMQVSSYVTYLPKRVNKYLPLALTPHAGIAIGLLVALESVDAASPMLQLLTPAILTAVTLSEVIGPLVLRFVLRQTGEEGQALPRLIDFIEEEYITVDVHAQDKRGVIIELVDMLFQTHNLKDKYKTAFLQSVLDRERDASTGMGKGIALPHGDLVGGPKIMGVMAIIPDGMEWESIDGKPVHMVVLVATPPEQVEQHVKVMGTISLLFSQRTVLGRGLHLAKNSADVYEALADEEFASLNRVIVED